MTAKESPGKMLLSLVKFSRCGTEVDLEMPVKVEVILL